MPMYFGYQAHREHSLGWRQPRSGRQMQQDPRYALRWHALKEEAESNSQLRALIYAAQRAGWTCREIVDVFEADLDSDIAEIRRRKVVLDRSRG